MVSSFKFDERLLDRQEAAEAKRVSDLEAAAKAAKLAQTLQTEFATFAEAQGMPLGTAVEGARTSFTFENNEIAIEAVADDRFLVAPSATSGPQGSPVMHDRVGAVDALIDWLFSAHERQRP